MPPHAATLLAHLQHLAAPAASDAALLTRWLTQRDESAFAALVARHGPMVLGVCRRVLGDAQHAEDAFQATFLVLARKAARLRRPEALASFLYGIALRLARKAHAAARRTPPLLNAKVPEPVDPSPHPLDVLSGRELLALLDAEVARLPEVYRLPLLLCVLQGRTVEEAARHLGWSVGSLRGRLARGREQLRRRLRIRGLDLSVGAVALLAPVVVPQRLLAASLRLLNSPTPVPIRALTEGWTTPLRSKAIGLGLLVLATAGLAASLPLLHAPQPQPPAVAAPPPAEAKEEPHRDRHGDPLPPGAIARLGTLRFRLDCDRVDGLDFTADGKTLATAEMYCGALHLWDVATGEPKPQPEGHSTHWPGTAAFSPDGQRVATPGSLDGTLRIWEAGTGRLLTHVRRSPRSVLGCGFSADGQTLFSCWDDKLIVSDSATGREVHAWKPNDPDKPTEDRQAIGMYLSEDRRKLIAFGRIPDPRAKPDCWLIGWDTATRKQLFRRWLPHGDSFWIAVSADAGLLASQTSLRDTREKGPLGEGPMRLDDLTTGERLMTFPTFTGQTWPLVFSNDGRLLISTTGVGTTSGWSQTLRLWEVLTASEVLALPTLDANTKAAFSPDGRLLAAPTPKGDILVWDLARGKALQHFKGHNSQVTSLAFSPDGRRLVSGLSDSTLLVWDVPAHAIPRSKLTKEEASKAWTELGDPDAARAFRARWTLAAAPEPTLALLSKQLRRVEPADGQRLRRLLADLESEQFAVRDKAQTELVELGELAEPALRKTLEGKPTLEVRRRVQALLERFRAAVTKPELLRSLRAVAVLEDLGTPPARRLLEELAQGAAEARLTREGQAALRRLQR
jgi:RNA polymerase sigma factor (sigma-70 family)